MKMLLVDFLKQLASNRRNNLIIKKSMKLEMEQEKQIKNLNLNGNLTINGNVKRKQI